MRFCLYLLLALCLIPITSFAQSTTGFEHPEDNSNLLEYRLPDWSYRTWTAGLSLDGGSTEGRYAGTSHVANSINLGLNTAFRFDREGDNRDYYYSASLDGSLQHRSSSRDRLESKSRLDHGVFRFAGGLTEYLNSGPFFVNLYGYTTRSYRGTIRENAVDSEWTKTTDIDRDNRYLVTGSLGYGKLRNVVPLLRAQRLNERLKALGLPQLSPEEIQQVAQVLAKEYGYSAVYSRADRHFWEDVLAPLVENQTQLSPFEVMYLMEVLDEKQGNRYQGFRVSLNYQWTEYASQRNDEWNYSHRYRPQVVFDWSTNPTLQQQIHIGTYASLVKEKRSGTETHEYRPIHAYAEHLWNVTDRTLWINRVTYSADSAFGLSNDMDSHSVELSSQYEFFIEDKLSLLAEVSGNFSNQTEDEEVSQSWAMTYRLGLQYDLNRAFFN